MSNEPAVRLMPFSQSIKHNKKCFRIDYFCIVVLNAEVIRLLMIPKIHKWLVHNTYTGADYSSQINLDFCNLNNIYMWVSTTSNVLESISTHKMVLLMCKKPQL